LTAYVTFEPPGEVAQRSLCSQGKKREMAWERGYCPCSLPTATDFILNP